MLHPPSLCYLPPSLCYLALSPYGTTIPKPYQARGLLAAFGTMGSVAKLSKRLCLPFSGAQRGLRDYRCVLRDLRSGGGGGGGGVSYLPLTPQSPLHHLRNDELEEGVVRVLIVDDIPAGGGVRGGGGGGGGGSSAVVMTDGAGLISRDLSAQLPRVHEGDLAKEMPSNPKPNPSP